jgi:hypothetical protein
MHMVSLDRFEVAFNSVFILNFIEMASVRMRFSPVVSLTVRFVGYYTSRFFCVNQWEEEKYFILFRYWLKSKGTLPLSL